MGWVVYATQQEANLMLMKIPTSLGQDLKDAKMVKIQKQIWESVVKAADRGQPKPFDVVKKEIFSYEIERMED